MENPFRESPSSRVAPVAATEHSTIRRGGTFFLQSALRAKRFSVDCDKRLPKVEHFTMLYAFCQKQFSKRMILKS